MLVPIGIMTVLLGDALIELNLLCRAAFWDD